MQILKINIIEFASMKNREFDFEKGLNIIEGENESGKSTLLSFIKFVLYGFPKGKSTEAAGEREKSYSWENGIAAGSVNIRTKTGDYKIERSAREGVKGEKLNIIDLGDGSPVYKGENPGELFLGVPLALFESTACVKQLGCTNLDGGEIGSAIQNLLLAADENLDTSRSIAKIDALRKRLLLKKGNGGSIYHLTVKRDELAERLRIAKERSVQIMEYETSFEKASKNYAESKEKLAKYTALNRAYEAKQALIKLEFVRSTKKRIENIQDQIDELKASECHEGFVPGAEYQRELLLANNDYENALRELNEKECSAKEARSRVPEKGSECVLAEKIEKNGGAAAIASIFGKAQKDSKKKKNSGIFFLITAFILGLLSAFMLCRSVLNISILPQIRFEILSNPMAAYICAAITAVTLLISVIFLINSSKSSKKAQAVCGEYGIRGKVSEKKFFSDLSLFIDINRRRNHMLDMLALAENELERAREKVKEKSAQILELLGKTGIKGTADEMSAMIKEVLKRSEDICARLSELESELSKFRVLYEDRSKDTADIDEKAMRAILTTEAEENLKQVNITVLRRDLEFEKTKCETAESRKNRLDRELVGMKAAAENPLRPESQLRKVEDRLRKETFLYEALTLASESIMEASEAMKKNVTPRLRAGAGERMSSLTNGKYSELGITPEFDITVNTSGVTRPIDSLSAGTGDAAYLSLRLALIGVLYKEEMPPLLLDEILSQIDDKRAARVLSMLEKYCAEGNQAVLFSCHSREASMAKANVIKL